MDTPKPSILYVDDEAENLVVFKSAFRRDYDILTANSAKEGMEILEQNHGVTVIISDQRMPDMTGVEFLKITSAKYPAPCKIILTGFTDMEVIIDAINSFDIFRYLMKPWNRDELKASIEKGIEVYNLKMENKHLVQNLQKANIELEQYSEGLEMKVKERTLELEQKNNQIIQSINYAKLIQDAILPSQKQLNSFFKDSFIFFKPRDIVSGDFYWVCENPEYYYIALVDCTGHGVPGAFMSMIGNTLLNSIINQNQDFLPSEILLRLDKHVKYALNQGEGIMSRGDGMDISVCRFDKKNQTVYISCANHVVYLFNRQNEMTEISGAYYSIGGIYPGRKEQFFTDHKVELREIKSLYMFSDGFIDQFGGENYKKFGSLHFKNLLKNMTAISMDEQKNFIENDFKNWQGSKRQIDDVTVLGLFIKE